MYDKLVLKIYQFKFLSSTVLRKKVDNKNDQNDKIVHVKKIF